MSKNHCIGFALLFLAGIVWGITGMGMPEALIGSSICSIGGLLILSDDE